MFSILILQLWETRIQAGCEQHNIDYKIFKESLSRSEILLNKKTLADLACWEPYSFKALTDIARRRALDDGLVGITKENSIDRIITKGSMNKL